MRLLLFCLAAAAASLLPALASPAAAEGPGRDKRIGTRLCRGNPQLDAASFIVSFQPDQAGPALEWSFAFDHCAQMGKSKGPVTQIQRIYRAEDGQGLLIRTDLSAAESSVSLIPFKVSGRHWDGELGLFKNSALVSGKALKAGPVRLRSVAREQRPELTGAVAIRRAP